MALKDNFKDQIPEGGKRLYQVIDGSTGAIIHNNIQIARSNGNTQEGDKYGAIEINEERKVINQLSNPNLLINGDFQVWQRGTEFNDVATGLYVADRWITNKGNSSILNINKHADGLKIYADNVAGIFQYVPIKKSKILGKNFALTFCIDNTAYTFNFTVENVGTIYTKEIGMNESTINNYYDETRSCFIVSVFLKDGKEHVINYAKLEYGELVTPFVSRPYAEELLLCKRYGRYICVDYTINAMSNSFSNMMSVPVDMRIIPTLTLSVGGTMVNITGERIAYSAFTDHILFSFTASSAGMMRVYGRKYWADAEIY